MYVCMYVNRHCGARGKSRKSKKWYEWKLYHVSNELQECTYQALTLQKEFMCNQSNYVGSLLVTLDIFHTLF